MKTKIRTGSAVIGALAIAAGSLFATQAASAVAVPPWEPDPTSAGALTFYDSTGAVITGGQITDAPFAAYIKGATKLRNGDTTATLFGYLPQKGVAIGTWPGEAISTSSTYPNTHAPAPINSTPLPVVSMTSLDVTLQTLIGDFPNNATDEYSGLYQLRLKTSAAGLSATPNYDSADILISGNTWTQVYPDTGAAVPTSTALTVKPRKTADHGAKVTLTATVSPASAGGSVKFYDGTKLLGTKAVSAGKAGYSSTALANGSHSLSATFVPTDSTAYTGSTSGTKKITVQPASTTTKLAVAPGTKVAKGTTLKLTATVSAKSAAGLVKFYDGRKLLAKVKVAKGVAKYKRVLSKGTHKLTAQFLPKSTQDYTRSTSKAVTVTVKA